MNEAISSPEEIAAVADTTVSFTLVVILYLHLGRISQWDAMCGSNGAHGRASWCLRQYRTASRRIRMCVTKCIAHEAVSPRPTQLPPLSNPQQAIVERMDGWVRNATPTPHDAPTASISSSGVR